MFDYASIANALKIEPGQGFIMQVSIRLIIVGSLVILALLVSDVSEHFNTKKQKRIQAYTTCVLDAPHKLPPNTDAALYCKTVLGL